MVDHEIHNAVNLKKRVNQVWLAYSNPIKVADHIWLELNPKHISLQPIRANATALKTGIRVDSVLRLTMGNAPVSRIPATLPTLQFQDASNSFFLSVPIEVNYDFVDSQLKTQLETSGNPLHFPDSGTTFISVQDAKLYVNSLEGILEVKFHGRINWFRNFDLTAYLTGTPTFDIRTGLLTFPDLGFTTDTQNIIDKVIVWLNHDHLRDILRKTIVLDLKMPMEKAKTLARNALNRKVGPVLLSSNVMSLQLVGISASPSSKILRADFVASGDVKATFK
jgi:hypothetical protein